MPTLKAFDAHLQETWVSSRNRWLWEKLQLEPEESASLSRLRDDALKQQDGLIPPRLVIAIDDFEGWLQRYPEYRRDLIRSVKELTAFPSFYWIIILQDTEYLAAAQNAERFWPTARVAVA